MKRHNRAAWLACLTAIPLVTIIATTAPSSAAGSITIANLAGSWQMTLIGQTGCGFGTTLATFTLNSSGLATNPFETFHTTGCGDGTGGGGDTFQILTLNPNGSGTANLTCGPGCGFNLNIQVDRDRSTFNVIDVSPVNPGNFLEGVAIRQ